MSKLSWQNEKMELFLEFTGAVMYRWKTEWQYIDGRPEVSADWPARKI